METSDKINENNVSLEKTNIEKNLNSDNEISAEEKVNIAKEKFDKAKESINLAKNEADKAYEEYQAASRDYEIERQRLEEEHRKAEEEAQRQAQNNVPFVQPYNNSEQYSQYQQAQQQYGFNNQQLSEYDRTHNKNIPETPEDKAKADKLCKWSVALWFIPQILAFIVFGCAYGFSAIFGYDYSSHSYGDGDMLSSLFASIYGIISLFSSISQLASFVLMIYVRVKYPKNTFGKVLMWIAIVFIALAFIATFVILAACMTALRDCPG